MSYSSRIATPLNSWDAVKLIALLLMFADHTGHFFYPHEMWLRAIGRGAAPVFLFLAGYAMSYRFKWDLLLLGILMGISDLLMDGQFRSQNILFTILIYRLILNWLEKKGKRVEKPYEWMMVSLAWVGTGYFVQYGGIGLLFTLCGYMKRRSEYYPHALQQRFWLWTIFSYIVFSAVTFNFSTFNIILSSVVLAAVMLMLWRFELRTINTKHWPHAITLLAKYISFYSGYIYAFHLIALEWLTGKPL